MQQWYPVIHTPYILYTVSFTTKPWILRIRSGKTCKTQKENSFKYLSPPSHRGNTPLSLLNRGDLALFAACLYNADMQSIYIYLPPWQQLHFSNKHAVVFGWWRMRNTGVRGLGKQPETGMTLDLYHLVLCLLFSHHFYHWMCTLTSAYSVMETVSGLVIQIRLNGFASISFFSITIIIS